MEQATPINITALVPPQVERDFIHSNRLRIEPVLGDGMAPDLRPGRDMMIVRPIDDYEGPGLYLLSSPGGSEPYLVEPTYDGRPVLVLMRSNRHYPAREISLRSFREAVLAKVVADVKMRDTNFSL